MICSTCARGLTDFDFIATNTGILFVAGRPETFSYDPDVNLTEDGR